MKAKIVYAAAIMLVVASWVGNYVYDRLHRLPEGGFLKHYVEARDIPSVAFDLYYVANRDDPRVPANVVIDELPTLRFAQASVHAELSHQKIYRLMGSFGDPIQASRPASDPLRIRTATVYYNDGTRREEEIGEIIVYREALPLSERPSSPFEMSSSSASSNNSGSITVRMARDVSLTGTYSAWLQELGASFRYGVSAASPASSFDDPPYGVEPSYPLELTKGQSLKMDYQFLLQPEDPKSMNVYNLLLGQHYQEPNGRESTNYEFANYVPYPTESEMRAYVREKRRESR